LASSGNSDARDRSGLPRAGAGSAPRIVRAIVAGGFIVLYGALYLRGLGFGRPIREHADEWRVTTQAMMMVGQGRYLRPFLYYGYGTLSIYLQCPVCAVTHWINAKTGVYTDVAGHPIQRDLAELAAATADPDAFNFFFAGRLSSAVYAAGLFVLLYVLGKRLFRSRAVACVCVLAAMVNPLVVQQGHFSLPNVLGVGLTLGAVYAAVAFVQDGRNRALYAGAALAGLAVAAKATMAWALVPVVLAAALRLRGRAVRHVPALMLVYVAVFVAVTPCAVLGPRQFLADVLGEAEKYKAGGFHDDFEMHPHFFGLAAPLAEEDRSPLPSALRYWVTQGRVHFAATLVGIAAIPFLAGSSGVVVVVFPLCYLVVVGFLQGMFVRSYLPLAPFWALGLGGAVALALRVLGAWGDGLRPKVKWRGAAVATAVVLSALALYSPARASWAVVRQFTTTDPLQTALAWLEDNVPEGSKVTTEKFWTPPQVPPPGRQFDVTAHQHSIFLRPYVAYLDQDYLVAPVTGMADRFAWYRRRFFPDETDPLYERMRRNRELAERRLELVRHVTPEQCGYVGVAEAHVAHDVYIYRVPEVSPVRLLPRDFRGDGGAATALALSGRGGVSAGVTLEAGAYDLFLQMSSRRAETQPWPRVAVSVAGADPRYVDAHTRQSAYYFVDTIRAADRRSLSVRVALTNGQDTRHGVLLESVVLVPVTQDESVPGSP